MGVPLYDSEGDWVADDKTPPPHPHHFSMPSGSASIRRVTSQNVRYPRTDGRHRQRSSWERAQAREEARNRRSASAVGGLGVRDGWIPAFLELLGSSANIAASLRGVGVSRRTYERAIANDPSFRLAVEEAKQRSADLAWAVAWEYGVTGVQERVWWKGRVVGQDLRRDPAMTRWVLETLNSERFGRSERVTTRTILARHAPQTR